MHFSSAWHQKWYTQSLWYITITSVGWLSYYCIWAQSCAITCIHKPHEYIVTGLLMISKVSWRITGSIVHIMFMKCSFEYENLYAHTPVVLTYDCTCHSIHWRSAEKGKIISNSCMATIVCAPNYMQSSAVHSGVQWSSELQSVPYSGAISGTSPYSLSAS